jgi:hypothetical protein
LKKSLCLGLIALLFVPITSTWATTDFSTLGTPNVTISPTSGPPGTQITITVSNLPDISKQQYPYPELYIYLPFSKPFGVTVPSHCNGEDCFPIYTVGDAQNHNFADRVLTFSLFSQNNPSPVYLNGAENTVCDVIMNGKKLQSYSTLCNVKDEPVGIYAITLGWALESDLSQNHIVKTILFTVTPGTPAPPPQVAQTGDVIIKEYQNGTITEAQFEAALKAIGWNDEQIRQAKAVIGKLPQYEGAPAPEQMQSIQQGVPKGGQVTSQITGVTAMNSSNTTTNSQASLPPPGPAPKSGCLIATAAFGSELAPQVQFLREIRDNSILTTTTGASFMKAFNAVYYSFSPSVADAERQNPVLKDTVRAALYPLLGILQLSEISQLGKSDIAVIGSGFMIASLIGATYTWPAGFLLKGIRNGTRPNTKIAIGVIAIATTSVVVSLLASSSIALILSTAMLVVSLVAVSGIFTAWSIGKLARKIRN